MIPVLTLTPTAASMLTNARDSQDGIPNDATLRIAASDVDGQPGTISIGFVEQPFEGDQSGDAHGLSYCVAPEVADQLDGAAIDVQSADGEARLVVIPAG
jgi:Fe-S cluster assembly iron-binding protein IscA